MPRLLASALVAVAAMVSGSAVADAAGLRTGCDRSRPAVAYRAGGGRALRPQPRGAPIHA